MPRNVRNFWIDAEIDGASTALKGGPRSKDGGLSVSLKVRDRGSVTEGLTIDAMPEGSYDRLRIRTTFAPGAFVETHEDGTIVVTYRTVR